MYNKRVYIFIALLTLGFACKKDLSTGDAAFNVAVEATNLGVGDTARFSFGGNPDVISFFSGEIGHRYEYKDRTEANGTAVMSFKTIRANGSQPNSLQLMVSTDFKGVVKGDTAATKEHLKVASWTDITSRVVLSTGSTTAISSGDVDLSDYAAASKPVFLAFKYNATAGSTQNKWTISSFTVKNVLPDGSSYEIANMNTSTTPYTVYGVNTFSPGFAAYNTLNNYNWSVSTTQLIITGASSASAATAPAEAWLFIGPVNLKKVIPDSGVPVKTPAQKIEDLKFMYVYPATGTYNATFIGGKISIDESTLTEKHISITVQ